MDGVPVALGEPLGDCSDPAALAKLMSIATAVRLAKGVAQRVYISRGLGEAEILAAFAGGADGILEDLSSDRVAVVEAADAAELGRALRRLGESALRPLTVLLAADLKRAVSLGSLVDGVALRGPWPEIRLEEVEKLPEIGRCLHCGVDYLMYTTRLTRCPHCGAKLSNVVTEAKPKYDKNILRSIYRKYKKLYNIKIKIV